MGATKPGQEPVKSGDRWKLTPHQRKKLAEWIGEGCTPREINKRAAALRSPFKISRQGVDYYRQKLQVKVQELRESEAGAAFTRGFALKDERIRVLDELANKILADLRSETVGLWLEDKKTIGSGDDAEIYTFKRFNAAQVSAVRELLADIAAEMGGRNSKAIGLEVPADTGNVKIYIGVDPDKV